MTRIATLVMALPDFGFVLKGRRRIGYVQRQGERWRMGGQPEAGLLGLDHYRSAREAATACAGMWGCTIMGA